jgi:hypothetical protein
MNINIRVGDTVRFVDKENFLGKEPWVVASIKIKRDQLVISDGEDNRCVILLDKDANLDEYIIKVKNIKMQNRQS